MLGRIYLAQFLRLVDTSRNLWLRSWTIAPFGFERLLISKVG
jgi:hypothetical protein